MPEKEKREISLSPELRPRRDIKKIFLIGAVAPQNQKSPSTTTSEPMWSYNLINGLAKTRGVRVQTFDIATLSLYRTLRGGLEVTIEEIAKLTTKSRPDLIGFSLLPTWNMHLKKFVEEMKKIDESYDPIVVGGGTLGTLAVGDLLEKKYLDYYIQGPGEIPFEKLVTSLRYGLPIEKVPNLLYLNEKSELITNPWDGVYEKNHPLKGLKRKSYWNIQVRTSELTGKAITGMVQTSSGCPGACTFCTIRDRMQTRGLGVDEAWVGYPALEVVEQIEKSADLIRKSGTLRRGDKPLIDIVDDEFIGNDVKRAVTIAEEIDRRKLDINFFFLTRSDTLCDLGEDSLKLFKKAGLIRIFLGTESGSNSQLKRMGKNLTVDVNIKAINLLRKCELDFISGFIMFEPMTTLEEVGENVNFINDLDLSEKMTAPTNSLVIYPGSPMEKLILSKKLSLGVDHSLCSYEYKFLDDRVERLSSACKRWNRVSIPYLMFLRREKEEYLGKVGGQNEYQNKLEDTWKEIKRLEWEAFTTMYEEIRRGVAMTDQAVFQATLPLQREIDLSFRTYLELLEQNYPSRALAWRKSSTPLSPYIK